VTAAPEPQHSRPLWVATILTPLVTPLAWFLILVVIDYRSGHPSPESLSRAIGIIYLIGLPLALGAMCLVGLPLVLLLRSQKMLTGGYVLIGASVTGVLTMAVFTASTGGGWESVMALWGLGLGFFAGLVFCFAAGIPFRTPRA
jgi:hypothetical protein